MSGRLTYTNGVFNLFAGAAQTPALTITDDDLLAPVNIDTGSGGARGDLYNQVKAIFVESSVSPDAIKSIAEDSGAIIGGELFSDAMGEPGEMESFDGDRYDLGTYEGMIKHNINTVVDSLK